MKVYISADIEGVAGIAHWDEARKNHGDYAEFREQMTREVAAACRGARAAGATEILIKDAHASGRNLLHRQLPAGVRLIRGWSGHPLSMVQELDEGFAAVMMIGYHSPASSGANPLAHTMSSSRLARVELNGRVASEFLLHAHAAAGLGVPVVLVSGDEALGVHVRETHPGILTVASGRGVGASTVARHPDEVVEEIEARAREALAGDLSARLLPLPETLTLRLRYKLAELAYRASQFPGAVAVDDTAVELVARDPLEMMRALLFLA